MHKMVNGERIELSPEEIKAVHAHEDERALKKAKTQYIEERQNAYPSIPEQLDMLYHDKVNGTDEWKKAITAVKERFPKPPIK